MQTTTKSKESYNNVRREWNEIFGGAIAAKRNWQILSFMQTIIVLVLVLGIVSLSSRSKVVPYIIEVDNFGRAMAYKQAEQVTTTDDRFVRAYLFRFIEKSRSVITDAQAMRLNLTEAYKMVTPELKQNVLNVYYTEHNPLNLARTLSRQTVPISCLKQSENTFLIEWKEIDRDITNKVIGKTTWKALITIVRIPPDTETRMKLDPMNPFGIFITSLSWSKIL